jgi:hypothetical protein
MMREHINAFIVAIALCLIIWGSAPVLATTPTLKELCCFLTTSGVQCNSGTFLEGCLNPGTPCGTSCYCVTYTFVGTGLLL